MNQNQNELNRNLQFALTDFQNGKYEDSRKLVLKVTKYQPKHDIANLLLVKIALKMNEENKVLMHFKNAATSPTFSSVGRSIYQEILQELFISQKYTLMQEAISYLLERNDKDGHAWYLLGANFQALKRNQDALNVLYKALEYLPGNLGVLTNIGGVLLSLGRAIDAKEILLQTLSHHGDVMISHNNLGSVYRHLGEIEKSIEQFKLSLSYNNSYAEAHNNLGLAYASKMDYESAITEYEVAIKCQPTMLMAYCNWAKSLHIMGRLKDAMHCCELALEIKNDSPEVWTCLADILRSTNHLDQSIESYLKALQYWPEIDSEASRMTFTGLLFSLNYHPELDGVTIFNAYKDYDSRYCLKYKPQNTHYQNEKILSKKLKIGYVTQSFFQQACVFFLLPLLENHDHQQVEIFAYTDLPKSDAMTEQYRKAVDHWCVTKGMSNEDIVQKIKDDGIDILIDVSGHTSDNRLLVFANKPAPISLHWLEFGYTTGLTVIDYYLCDKATIPYGSEHLFSEKPWYLDGPAYAYRPSPQMGQVNELPAIKNDFITFGTLSRSIRLNHKVLRVWAQIMLSVPNSKLIIDSSDFKDPCAQEELELRFNEYGISKDRLEIGFHTPAWDVLKKMDIGLDCFPHNSGTTLFEALYMGMPYVTLAGRASVGRLGASILEGLGRPEWIALSEDEYIQKVIDLASDVPRLAQMRSVQRQKMQQSLLMNEPAFAHSVEKAYRQMWQIYCEGNQT